MSLQLNQIMNLLQTRELTVVTHAKDHIVFRVDLFQPAEALEDSHRYRFRVFRYDLFRILPTSWAALDKKSTEFADHEFLVVDPMFDLTEVEAGSPSQAWDQLLERMRRQFDPT